MKGDVKESDLHNPARLLRLIEEQDETIARIRQELDGQRNRNNELLERIQTLETKIKLITDKYEED